MQIPFQPRDPKAYSYEFINVCLQAADLTKNPQAGVRDIQLRRVILFILSSICMLWSIIFSILNEAYYMLFFTGWIVCNTIYYIAFFVDVAKRKKALKFDGSFVLDNYGIAHIRDSQMTKVFWSNIKAVRVYKHTLAFLVNDPTSTILVAPAECKDMFLGYMYENGINIPVVDPSVNMNMIQQPGV